MRAAHGSGWRRLALVSCALLAGVVQAVADEVITVATPSAELSPAVVTPLGEAQVPELGTVRVEARRDDRRLVLLAYGPDGAAVGRSETTIGLSENPVYVATPAGLRAITVRWARPPGNSGGSKPLP